MEKITTVGIDLAKNVFSVHGVDRLGRVVLKKTVSRAKLVETVAQWPVCAIGMEACTGAHEWARRFEALGHTVRLMAPKFVAPYRKSGKNDGNDADAICEAVARPNMRFVPVKSVEQQAVLTLHRARQGYVEERTATINRIRGLMAEFGVVLAQRSVEVRRGAARAAEALPQLARQVIDELLEHLRLLDARIEDYERRLASIASDSEAATRLMQLSGIGPITASAVVATVGEAKLFDSGRQFAAWLGLTPRQYSTGGKTRLGHITRRGDRYLRTLFIMGARSVLQSAPRHDDRRSRWARSVRERCGYHKAVVAIAAKNARIAWALLAKGQPLVLPS
jgi:transposase